MWNLLQKSDRQLYHIGSTYVQPHQDWDSIVTQNRCVKKFEAQNPSRFEMKTGQKMKRKEKAFGNFPMKFCEIEIHAYRNQFAEAQLYQSLSTQWVLLFIFIIESKVEQHPLGPKSHIRKLDGWTGISLALLPQLLSFFSHKFSRLNCRNQNLMPDEILLLSQMYHNFSSSSKLLQTTLSTEEFL